MTRASGDGSLIAVVGMSCRLPRARDLGAYWRLLASGEQAIAPMLAERRELAGPAVAQALAEADAGADLGGFLDDVEEFDAAFFGISPTEAQTMDPHQRLALELSWEALEDARIAAGEIRGDRAGVFLGAIAGDYETLSRSGGPAAIGRHTATGLHRSIIANRVSYVLGLTGPSLTVDTGQSSSLVSVHLACESLRRGEATLALAGGVHLNLDPRSALTGSRFGGFSPDGRCFTFDARANGYVRGEGGGVVALKPLAAARADGDRIHCVIRGSAMNNDGASAGLSVPSVAAQERMLDRAYRRAGMKRSEVQYVELHGSGTAVGDPIEAAALGAVLGAGRAADEPLSVGSAKTNIGHLEGAAGIAGLIKAVLAIEHRQLPASLNFERPHPEIPLEELRLRVQGSHGGWPREGQPLSAGVSSFGVGGTNCHVVITEAPSPLPAVEEEPADAPGSLASPLEGAPLPFLLSGKSPEALRAQASRLASQLQAQPELEPRDVAYSLIATREQFDHRAVLLASEERALLDGLAALEAGEPAAGLTEGRAARDADTALVFPGYGSQWEGMALGLLDSSAIFRGQIAACTEALEPLLGYSLEDALRGAEGAPPLERPDVGQSAVFAMAVALAALWRSFGVEPVAVVGHSQGEIAAAHFAGGLSLDDAARILVLRNRALVKLVGKGAMASVALPVAELEERLSEWQGRLELGAINGPGSAVVSGDPDALDELLRRCEEESIRVRKVRGAVAASHSAQVEVLREELLSGLAPVSPRSGAVPFHSTVTGGLLDTAELDAEYWYRNARHTVRLAPVVGALLDSGVRALIEVSPHPVLGVGLQEAIEAAARPGTAAALGSLRRGESGTERFALSLAEAHVAGVEVEWGRWFAGSGAAKVNLPSYPFQRSRHWVTGGGDPDDERAAALLPGDDDDQDASVAPGRLAQELAGLPEKERQARALERVRAETAVILGHRDPEAIDVERSFKELGFDSPAAVELRKRLVTASGLRLPATVVFDHPSPVELAARLVSEALGEGSATAAIRVRPSEEPIAIVGMACRYPGGVGSPEQLWQLLAEGRDAIGEFPADRGWDLERLFDPDPDRAGTFYAQRGGFLDEPGHFDAEFFGISPREATAMDPQQRLLLETCWEALEDAGLDPSSLRGSPTGVFAGAAKGDYNAAIEGYRMTGGLASVIAGRISYTLGLEGPAMAIDTACSSSLVAAHLAVQALQGGECSLALAGGATVLATPESFVESSRQRALSPDGRCKSFAEGADGTGWAEGAGVLVLERLSDAERQGHRVLATIRGSAVNQDGASNGLTAPNGPSQERVIRQALANAGLEPKDIDAVEAHGTGTALGDPIEAGALLATYGQERELPLKLGSVKSNIGHTLAAAGVAGVIKMVLALRAGMLPRTLHAEAPSSRVDWQEGKVELLAESVPWEANGHPRRAAVSSFGISGTNAHLILEEAPAAEQVGATGESISPLPSAPALLPLSAKSEPALRGQAASIAQRLQGDPDLNPTDIGFSLATTRTAFDHRATVLGSSREQLLARLTAFAGGEIAEGAARGSARRPVRVAFLFSGQGSQWQGMALELIESSPFFARHMEACEEALSPFIDHSMRDFLAEDEGTWMQRVDVVQPLLFATTVSLARLWLELGVRPAAVVGHSTGEIPAAHIAGGLTLSDAARVVAVRSQVFAKLAGRGGMATIALTADRLAAYLEGWEDRIEVAAYNGPSSAVLTGGREALDELLARCAEDGIRARDVPGAVAASHSVQIEAVRKDILEALAGIAPRSGEIPFHSTVTGGPLDTAELDAEYWYRNTRQPVLFEPVVRDLIEAGHETLIEVGPHPVMAPALQETVEAASKAPDEVTVLGTLRRGEGGAERFALSLAEAHAAGAELDWQAYFAGSGAKAVALPTYPFQRRRYWLNAGSAATDPTSIGQRAIDHPFLAAAIEEPEGEGLALSGRISLDAHPWLADHAAFGTVLFPGAGFLELALRAGQEAGAPTVKELTLQAPLVLPEQGAVALRVTIGAEGESGLREVAIHARPEGEASGAWTCHARGSLSTKGATEPRRLPAWPPPGAGEVNLAGAYERLADAGFDYGPAFQGLTAAWRDGDQVFAEVRLAEDLAADARGFAIHPALLDAALHAFALEQEPGLPFSWSGVTLAAPATELRVKLSRDGQGVSLDLADAGGAPLATIDSLAVRPLDPAQIQPAPSLLEIEWREVPHGPPGEDATLHELPTDSDDPAAATLAALGEIQAWLAEEREGRLALLTRGAVATSEAESPDPALAAAWGLVRSAQSEHPGRFALIDTDGTGASEEALTELLACAADPQIALREGEWLVPRAAAAGERGPAEPPVFDPERTVLITGGTGALGSLVARHLVTAHGARHLLLATRSGPGGEAAEDLRAVLQELGAEVTLATCDVSDREQLEELLAAIPTAHPLGAVIHAAAALDDATVEALRPQQVEAVFAAKAKGAHHLHELTAGLDLSHFVLFSSAAGVLGAPGQANYAAANAFLDALAARRRAAGEPATSIAWGLWKRTGEAGPQLSATDLARLRRSGIAALSDERGLAMLDRALASEPALFLAADLDAAALRVQARAGLLPPLLGSLVRLPASERRAAPGSSLATRLASAPEADRGALVLELVRGEVAAVLSHASAADIDPARAFKELGFDSLAAVELRNRLNAATGVSLAATAVFDFPTPAVLAEHLLALASGTGAARRLAVRARATEEPIAIVGMACRYPGGVESPQALWELVESGGDAISGLPLDRGWDPQRIYADDPNFPASVYTREGGFLVNAAGFDSAFFGISPREAAEADPQQRLLLETSWEALEGAGIDPGALRGAPAGVFAGVMHHDYGGMADDASAGMAGGAASGRVAYTLGLEGPAMTIDTACSSSLVALHLAAQALRGGECELALAGGATVLATPRVFTYFSRQRGLAPDGRCKAFAEGADGVGVSEGAGVLVLERLSDAERQGHRVLATIRGSAVNQDGASNGLTAPNGPSQERVIRQALANAGLEPKDIDAVEAHGTGTALGDPIEAGALLATYGQERELPLKLGSVKSNIGHTQAAAGVAGVIKAVMAMRNGVLPKTLHLDAPSSKVEWEAGKVELLSEAEPWEAKEGPRRMGVSSFGATGTNAHLVLEEMQAAPPSPEGTAVAPHPTPLALPLSARSEPALAAQAKRLAAHMRAAPGLEPLHLAFSLATTRAAFEHRAALLGGSREELLEGLDALGRGERAPGMVDGRATPGAKLAYLLTGQGSQRPGMGRELYEAYPAYAEALEAACAELDPHLERSLAELLFCEPGSPEAGLLDHTTYAQPALFATAVALYRLLESRGLRPDLLCGHSIGELTAAHLAGVLSLPDAASLVAARGRLMGELPEGGAMAALAATEAEVAEVLVGRESELSLAAINGPSSVVVSGVAEAVEEVAAHFAERGRKTKRLAVSHAFHSPLMEPMLAEFAALAAELDYAAPQIPIVSNLSGELLDPAQATDPAYWVAHVREPVRFAAGLATLRAQGATAFLELGPEALLTASARECLAEEGEESLAFAATLRRERPETETLTAALAQAHAAGAELDWQAYFAGSGAKAVALPTYPFQRRRYWLNATSAAADPAAIGQRAIDHPFLAAAIEEPEGEGLALSGRISLDAHPWLADHAAFGTVLFPGAGFLELALRAGQEAGAPTVKELTLQAPLVLPEQGAVQIRVSVAAPDQQGAREISIHSRPQAEEEWTRNASGALDPAGTEPSPEPPSAWPPPGAEPLESGELYARLAEAGFDYGPAFQGLTAAWREGEQIYAEVSLPQGQSEEAGRFVIHPALLDAAGQGIAMQRSPGEKAELPFAWRDFSLRRSGESELRVKLVHREDGAAVELDDRDGAPVSRGSSLELRAADPARLQGRGEALFAIEWIEVPLDAAVAASGVTVWRHEPDEGNEDQADLADVATKRVLELIQEGLAANELGPTPLTIVTQRALAVGEGSLPDPSAAAIWGLARSAQSEHPGRFALIDTDGSAASEAALEAAIAASASESQLALREGVALAPRMTPVGAEAEPEVGLSIDPDSTVLVTGATGAIGALLARHLVSEHGARHLLLVSRRGPEADGATQLREELQELGAEVSIVACDVADRAQLEELLGSIPPKHPLGAVIHAAGTVEDATVERLTPEQLERVLAVKAAAAWHLHELTAGRGLSAFVLFSSAAGVLGAPGQANYAAANAFLDALAARRRATGEPAVSIAWGAWSRQSSMTSGLGAADLARTARAGVSSLSDARGLSLFDRGLSSGRAEVLALELDRPALRLRATTGTLPPILGGLVRSPAAPPAAASLARQLQGVAGRARERAVEDFVRTEVSAVLGHASAAAVGREDAFKDLGFDSLAAIELRNRLGAATGTRLAASVVFDYPNVAALGSYLLAELGPGEGAAQPEAALTGPGQGESTRGFKSGEPIAIVGMACRYPGGAGSPQQLWELVAGGIDAISAFPRDRGWDVERLYDPDPDSPGSMYVRESGFLEDAAEFDAEFFGIGPREATAIDPQQRLLLETSWEALEGAGIDPSALRGSRAGVFAGTMYHDYGSRMGYARADLEGYIATGAAASIASGRVAYTLGLEGPAMTIDTACSSSLVALHLAAQALRGGECELALAGGATVMWTPDPFVLFSRQRGLAPDGRCKSFAESADGVGWSEGAGVLVLERLSDAERQGHRVLATIRGSAVNQDGASNGLTAPNGPSQERVIRQALANAGLEPKDIDAVEAHGTGTALGDPIEAGALLATYGQERELPLKLGSVKSNIGHTQAAAGVAGVIKAVMAMRNGVLPKTLHLDAPSSKVEWEAGKVELLSEAEPWEAKEGPRRMGVSSFGISGTNAHLILEEMQAAPPSPEGTAVAPHPTPLALPLSARSEPALAAQAKRLAAHMRAAPGLEPLHLAFSLATTRAAFEHRAALLGGSREELLEGLDALGRGERAPGMVDGRATPGAKLAYLLTGQGSQRPGMGRELYEAYPAYAEALEAACAELDPHLERSLAELLFCEPGSPEAGLLDHTTYAQPALFATAVALYRLLESRGLRPDLLCGHSIGELTAAHLAGVLSLPDAASLVAARGRLMGELPEGGAMAALAATEAEVAEVLVGRESELSLAAINGPSSVVVSGVAEAVEEVAAHFAERGRKTKRLAVSHAFHSPLMEPMLAEFAALAAELDYAAPQIPIVSNLSGELLDPAQATDPAYWVAHVREPVRFAAGLATLRAQGATAFLELGPEALLTASARECLAEEGEESLAFAATLRRERPETETLTAALAQAHAAGAELDWQAYFAGSGAKAVALPTYPFQRRRYWLNATSAAADPAAIGQRAIDHPFLAAAIEEPEGEGLALSGRISLDAHPWLADHAAFGTVLFPGAGFLELALRAGQEAGAPTVKELTLQAPLVLPEQGAVQIRVSVAAPDQQGAREISIHSRPQAEEEWTRNASGALDPAGTEPSPEPPSAWPPPGAEPLESGELYARLAEAGFDYGPAFQGLTAAWREGEQIYAEVSLPQGQSEEAGRFVIHPALLDAAGQGIAMQRSPGEKAELPFAWRDFSLRRSGESELRVKLVHREDGAAVELDDRDGAPVSRGSSLELRAADPARLQGRGEALFAIEWIEVPLDAAVAASGVTVWRHEPDEGNEDQADLADVATKRVLELIQEGLAANELGPTPLTIVTQRALAVGEGSLPDPSAAAICGLVRSAHSEHPGRFALIDTDGSAASEAALEAAIAASASESQLALREGELLVPRLARVEDHEPEAAGEPLDLGRTVLITGASGAIGALLARHLISEHGARHLLLVSRRGPEAEGATQLREELQELGAEVSIVACDVADRAQLEGLLGSIPQAHPLGAVFHCAAVLDDGLLESLDRERLARVMGPKAEAAWHLHELTAGLELSHFVLFSSIAGLLGGAGQANYAAANAFLDALAADRRAQGLAGASMAWGLWTGESAAVADLDEADLARATRQIRQRLGLASMPPERGLALFDAALKRPEPLTVPAELDTAALRAQARAATLPALLRGLVRMPAQRQGESGSLARRLAAAPEAERESVALELVLTHVAAVLGHDSVAEVEPEKAFKDLGFDSLAAVELRNRLAAASGLSLPASLAFDYPTPTATAGHLVAELAPGTASGNGDGEEEIKQALARIPVASLRRAGLLETLLDLAGAGGRAEVPAGERVEQIDSMDIGDLVEQTLDKQSVSAPGGGEG